MFYKMIDNTMFSGISVSTVGLELVEIDKDQHEYPVDGWYWFDMLEDANLFFNILD